MKIYKSRFKNILEKITKDRVVRQGKKQIKYSTDRENYKIDTSGSSPKEVKMSPEEIRKRAKGAKKGARKAKSKSNRTAMKRAKSMKRK